MKKIQIINGPNLNLLGRREPGVYGAAPFDDCLASLRRRHPEVQIDYFQSNIEGELIDCIHRVGFDYDGIILNAGAYTHTSIALQDAIRAVPSACRGVVCGFGTDSYRLALEGLLGAE